MTTSVARFLRRGDNWRDVNSMSHDSWDDADSEDEDEDDEDEDDEDDDDDDIDNDEDDADSRGSQDRDSAMYRALRPRI